MGPYPAPGGGATVPARKAPQILVVEDEFLIRMLISDALRDEGFGVVEAFNGDEAAEILVAGMAPDLIFSDVRMPGSLDGLGLLGLIRDRAPGVPVVLTSGHLDPRQALDEGARHFLRKPYDIGKVIALVTGILGKSE
jgi:CheY-like chemotaxis protein